MSDDDPDPLGADDRPGEKDLESDPAATPAGSPALDEVEIADEDLVVDEGHVPNYEVVEYSATEGGHRIVTRRSIHRREIETETKETITEVIPEPYQGPRSEQPPPVG